MDVLCVTPNASVDRILTVPGFDVGGVWRAASTSALCGGKGVNVARTVVRLGHGATCAGLLGGHSGRLAAELAAAEGLRGRWTWIAGESRTCVVIVGDGASTVVNEAGPAIVAADWGRFVADVGEAAAAAAATCISGSMPAGCPKGGVADLVAAARPAGRPVWIDTSGTALEEAVSARPAGVKINGAEAAALLGGTDGASGSGTATAIRDRGVGTAVVTLGAAGAVLAAAEGTWRARPPRVAAVNPTGAGDSFLAALVVALQAGSTPPEALRRATAVGTARVLHLLPGELDPADVVALMPRVEVSATGG